MILGSASTAGRARSVTEVAFAETVTGRVVAFAWALTLLSPSDVITNRTRVDVLRTASFGSATIKPLGF